MKKLLLFGILFFLLPFVFAYQELSVDRAIPITLIVMGSEVRLNTSVTTFVNQPHNNNYTQTFLIPNTDIIANVTECSQNVTLLNATLGELKDFLPTNNTIDLIFKRVFASERGELLQHFDLTLLAQITDRINLSQQLTNCLVEKADFSRSSSEKIQQNQEQRTDINKLQSLNNLMMWIVAILLILLILCVLLLMGFEIPFGGKKATGDF